MDSFVTIASPCEAELKEKSSRFLAYAAPVASREEAERLMEQIRRTHFDASHHCYAYRIGIGSEEVTRAVDDGEPAGSAGKPILSVIQGEDLTNVLVAVTRWFGGIKLGVGGLARAYAESTKRVLELCQRITCYETTVLEIEFPYQKLSPILKVVEQFTASVISTDYADTVRLYAKIRRSRAESFIAALQNAAAGRIKIEMQ